MIQHNKVCSQGNRAFIQCRYTHKKDNPNQSSKLNTAQLLCNKLTCQCRTSHTSTCNSTISSTFHRMFLQAQSKYIFLDDEVRKLNYLLAGKQQECWEVYRKELVGGFDRMIERIRIEKQELLQMIQRRDLELVLDPQQMSHYRWLTNKESVAGTPLVLQSSSKGATKAELDELRRRISGESNKLEKVLKENLEETREKIYGQSPFSQPGSSVSKQKFTDRRKFLDDEMLLNQIRMLKINKISADGVQIEPDLSKDIEWQSVTSLILPSIDQTSLTFLCSRAINLRELKIINKITPSQAKAISCLGNLESVSFKLKMEPRERSNKSYDCDYCNDRRKESDRENAAEHRRGFRESVDQLLSYLLDNPKLHTLNIQNSRIEDYHLKMAQSQSLRDIAIRDNSKVSFWGLNQLSIKFPNLEAIAVNKLQAKKTYSASEEDSRADQTEVRRSQQQMVDQEPLRNFFNHTRLKSLKISNTDLSDSQLELLLTSFPHLTTLCVDQTLKFNDQIIRLSLSMPDLVSLSINSCGVRDQGLMSIAKYLKKLKVLSANGNMFTEYGVLALTENLTNLKELMLRENVNGLRGKVVGFMGKHLTALERLDIKDSFRSSNSQLISLSKIKTLRQLIIYDYDLFNWQGFDRLSRNLGDINLAHHLKKQSKPVPSPFQRFQTYRLQDNYTVDMRAVKTFRNLILTQHQKPITLIKQ